MTRTGKLWGLAVLPLDTVDKNRLEAELAGNTLRVYWYLLGKGRNPSGVREVQRAMNFSSPSSASYHLEKLRELGLLNKNLIGNYTVIRIVKVGILNAFIFVGGCPIPKHLLYAMATTALILFFVLSFLDVISWMAIASLLPGVMAAVIFWCETIMVWRRRPKSK